MSRRRKRRGRSGISCTRSSRARSAAMSWVLVAALSGLSRSASMSACAGSRCRSCGRHASRVAVLVSQRRMLQRAARRSMLGWLSSCVKACEQASSIVCGSVRVAVATWPRSSWRLSA